LILAGVQASRLQFGLWFWLGALSGAFSHARVQRIERRLSLLEIERKYEGMPATPNAPAVAGDQSGIAGRAQVADLTEQRPSESQVQPE
jgi:hypothetical protein